MKLTLDPCWVSATFLSVSPTLPFQTRPLISFLKNCAYSATKLSSCVIKASNLRAAPLEPTYFRALITNVPAVAGKSSGEGWSLTCMASIVSLTTMSGFTLAVNCPPPGFLVPSCWIRSFLFFPFRFPADWERSESADSWLRFLSHMQPDTPN